MQKSKRLIMKLLTTILILLSLLVSTQAQSKEELIKKYELILNDLQTQSKIYDEHVMKNFSALKEQDATIEKQVKAVIALIKKFSDSRETGTKVLKNKESIIDGLKKSIDYYAAQRKSMNQEMVNVKRYPEEDLQKIKNWLDEKMIVRINEIVEVTKSLGDYKDHHDYYGYSYNSGKNIDKEKAELAKDMDKAKEDLEKRIATLEKQFDQVDPRYNLTLVGQELTALYKKVDILNQSMEDVKYAPSDKTREMSREGERTLDKDLREMTADIKSEFQSFTRGFAYAVRTLQKRKSFQDEIIKYEDAIAALKAK
jgi:chaperonin cofactor prefoldin